MNFIRFTECSRTPTQYCYVDCLDGHNIFLFTIPHPCNRITARGFTHPCFWAGLVTDFGPWNIGRCNASRPGWDMLAHWSLPTDSSWNPLPHGWGRANPMSYVTLLPSCPPADPLATADSARSAKPGPNRNCPGPLLMFRIMNKCYVEPLSFDTVIQ